MKKKIPYLTPTEYAFMTVLWSAERPLTASEILNRRVEGTWAKNSIHPLLNALLDKGFISVQGMMKVSKVNSRLFKAKISLAEYTSSQINKVFENDKISFSLPEFLSNLVETNKSSNEELIDELENWLEKYKEKE